MSVEKAEEEAEHEKPSDEEYEAFAQKILKFHNDYRRKHHADDLKWVWTSAIKRSLRVRRAVATATVVTNFPHYF